MPSDEFDTDRTDLQRIPITQQGLSLEAVTDADYEVVPPSATEDNADTHHTPAPMGRMTPPGRTPFDDSIEASSDDVGEDDIDAYALEFDSPAATRIGKADEGDERIDQLRKLHEERHPATGDFSSTDGARHKERTAQALCSSLPLTDREREMVVTTVTNIDFSRFGQQGSIPRVTLGAVAVVVDQRHRELEDLDDAVCRSEEFRDACETLDVSMSDLGTIKECVQEALDGRRLNTGPEHSKRDPALPAPTPLDDVPDEYWEAFTLDAWAEIAEKWTRQSKAFRRALPPEYRDLVHRLRRLAPWDEEDGEPETDDTTTSAASPDDAAVKEAETLLDEMAEEVQTDRDTNNE